MNNNAGLLNYYTKLLLPLNCLSSLAADKQYYYLCDHSDTTCMCVIQKQWLLLCKVIKPWCPRTYTAVFSCVVCVDVCVRDLQRPQPAFKQVSEKQLVCHET